MAWRFKASKYKNTVPVEPKLDKQVRELSIGSYHSCGNFIAASASHMAFNWDTVGSSLAVLPLTASGRPDKASIPRIDGHSDTVNDFSFSPFDDTLLVTGSNDQTVKLWKLPEDGHLYTNLTRPEVTLPEQPRKVETVGFNPVANGILATSSGTAVNVWDFTAATELWGWDGHGDKLQCVAWQWEGRLLATQARDKQLRLFDPRASAAGSSGAGLVAETASHDGLKDSKVVWVGENRLLTSGFGADRARELILRDTRKLSTPQYSLSLDVSSGILIPLYDPDTNMVFLSGKGDRAIQFVEVTDRDPWFVEGLRYTGEQIKGACLVPKRALDVMQCEVNRVLLLGNNSVIPIMWQVPRKSYREYQADVFPDTPGPVPTTGPQDWIDGGSAPPRKISLNPAQRKESLVAVGAPVSELPRKLSHVVSAAVDNGGSVSSSPPAAAAAAERKASDSAAAAVAPSLTLLSTTVTSSSSAAANNQQRAATDGAAVHPLQPSPKPSPRARVVSRTASVDSNCQPSPVPAPRLSSTSSSVTPSHNPSEMPPPPNQPRLSSSKSVDEPDDAPSSGGGFKRQPSIRDRMRMFERASVGDGGAPKSAPTSAVHKTSIAEENAAAAGGGIARPKSMTAKIERDMDVEEGSGGADNGYNSHNSDNHDNNKENDAPRNEEKNGGNKVKFSKEDAGETEDVVLRPKIRKDSNNPFMMSQLRPQSCVAQPNNRLSRFGRVTKFRHLKGTPLNKSKHFENLKNLSKALPAECDFLQANSDRLAVPLAGPGGKLAILETAKSGRISDGVPPAVINTGSVMDFAWDPFNNQRLAVVTDEGALNLWTIPEDGLHFQVNQPDRIIHAHSDKVSIVKFNPTAADVVATAAFDWTVKIWNLHSQEEKIVLTGHTDQIYSLAWSQCGRFLGTVCRDGRVRIYDPRSGSQPVREGGDVAAKKGARIVWALDGKFLIVSGFSSRSERQIMIHDTTDLSCIHTETMDVSPAILIPYYDEDSSTLFLTGKGEVTVYAWEVAEDSPYMFPLSSYKTPNPTQGLAFLQHKNVMNVRKVEFARAYRLTANTIEPTSFTVPRVKSTFFQDDIFPPTRVMWEPAISASAWFQGETENIRWVSLKPADMPSLSGSTPPVASVETNKTEAKSVSATSNIVNLSKDEAREVGRDLTKAVGDIIETSDKLEQDGMEGVEEKEWEEEE